MEKWRENDKARREEFVLWAAGRFVERQGPESDSVRKYGDEFRGDPLQQAEEEVLDAVFYLYFAKKQRDYLEGQLRLAAVSDEAAGTVFVEAVQENLQRALRAEQVLGELFKAESARMEQDGVCVFCFHRGYNPEGERHYGDCVMARAERVLEGKGDVDS